MTLPSQDEERQTLVESAREYKMLGAFVLALALVVAGVSAVVFGDSVMFAMGWNGWLPG